MKVIEHTIQMPGVQRPQAHLTPSNWYQIFKAASQNGYANIWEFLESMRK